MVNQQQHDTPEASLRSMRSQDTEFTEESTLYNDERPEDYYWDSEDEEEEEEEERDERVIIVRFSEQVLCKATISRSDYSPREIAASWYTEEERQRLLNKYAKTCERRRSGKKPKKNSTYRGLEHFEEDDAMDLQRIIETCVEAVLEEQDRQIEEGIYDEEALADLSMCCSEECRDHAVAMARHDEREARKAHRQMLMPLESDHSVSSFTVAASQDLEALLPHKTSQSSTAIVVRKSTASQLLMDLPTMRA